VRSTYVDWRAANPPFQGFALWSGTSFAAPMVAAAIAARYRPGGIQTDHSKLPKSARAAADELMNDLGAKRVVGLGTIIRPPSYVS
jgi:hypothetical protein